MNRLSIADLKAQKGNVIANLEAINGGNAGNCHSGLAESFGNTVLQVVDAFFQGIKEIGKQK